MGKNLLLSTLLLFVCVPLFSQSVDGILQNMCDEACDAVYITAYDKIIPTRIWIKHDSAIIPIINIYYVYIHIGELKGACLDDTHIVSGLRRIIKCRKTTDNSLENKYMYKLNYRGTWFYFNSNKIM